MGPFCDGVIGPIIQRSGRTPWQALDQPINTNPPGGWIQAATLGVHNWTAIFFIKMAGQNEQFFTFSNPKTNLFSIFLREGVKSAGRMDPKIG